MRSVSSPPAAVRGNGRQPVDECPRELDAGDAEREPTVHVVASASAAIHDRLVDAGKSVTAVEHHPGACLAA